MHLQNFANYVYPFHLRLTNFLHLNNYFFHNSRFRNLTCIFVIIPDENKIYLMSITEIGINSFVILNIFDTTSSCCPILKGLCAWALHHDIVIKRILVINILNQSTVVTPKMKLTITERLVLQKFLSFSLS